MDPVQLVEWLPPGEMTGRLHEFDGRAGGGYRMSLFYPPSEGTHRGKTTAREDMVSVRFVGSCRRAASSRPSPSIRPIPASRAR